MSYRNSASSPMWGWRNEPREPGEVVLVDIDGVLADARHRQHFLDNDGWRDWDEFLAAASDDDVISEGLAFVQALPQSQTVALVTSRPAWVGGITVNWLEEKEIPWHMLVMRSNHDYRKAFNMKLEAVSLLEALGFTPVLAVDDNRDNIAAYADAGLETKYIHSGYHED